MRLEWLLHPTLSMGQPSNSEKSRKSKSDHISDPQVATNENSKFDAIDKSQVSFDKSDDDRMNCNWGSGIFCSMFTFLIWELEEAVDGVMSCKQIPWD